MVNNSLKKLKNPEPIKTNKKTNQKTIVFRLANQKNKQGRENNQNQLMYPTSNNMKNKPHRKQKTKKNKKENKK